MTLTVENLVAIAMTNPINAQITARLPSLGLSQCMLTAGCLFQAVWNHQAQQPPAWGIKDYDVFYFDTDLSWEAENEVINSVRRLFQDLDVNVEVKNQARIHLWYHQRFGSAYPQLLSTTDGVDRYLVAGKCIGLDVETGEVYAPNGLAHRARHSADQPQKCPTLLVRSKGEKLSGALALAEDHVSGRVRVYLTRRHCAMKSRIV